MEASAAILVVEAEIVHRHAVARFGHFGRAVVGVAVQRGELPRVAVGGRRPAPAALAALPPGPTIPQPITSPKRATKSKRDSQGRLQRLLAGIRLMWSIPINYPDAAVHTT
jgi:hypothetical protein